jgi:GGDEF domain-containing protein
VAAREGLARTDRSPGCRTGGSGIVERLRLVTPLVTCSVGPACWDVQENATELVKRADQALYAKAEGRNRYVLAS